MRSDNTQIVGEIKGWCSENTLMVAAAYHGLSASAMTTLRNRVAESKGEMHVVKNRLMRRALTGQASSFADVLAGPNAVIATKGDAVALAKVLVQFAKEHNALAVHGGLLDCTQFLTADALKALAALPPRDVLLARIMCAVQGPVRGVACAVHAVLGGLVRALDQIAKKKADTPA